MVDGASGSARGWFLGANPLNNTPHTSHFLVDSHLMTRTCVAQAQVWRAQRTFHIISCVIFMRSCCVFDSPATLPSSSCCPFSLLSSCSSTWSSASSSRMWRTNPLYTLTKENLGTVAEYDPLTGYEPNDDHISKTTEPYIQESAGEHRYLNSHDLENDDYTIGMALSSPLFTQKREDGASRGQAYHSPDEGLSSSQSSFVGHRTGRPVVGQFDAEKIRVATQRMSKSRFFWNDKEIRFSLIVEQKFKNTSSRSIMTEEVFKN